MSKRMSGCEKGMRETDAQKGMRERACSVGFRTHQEGLSPATWASSCYAGAWP